MEKKLSLSISWIFLIHLLTQLNTRSFHYWFPVFLESLIQSSLLLDVGSVVTKSNPDFPMDRSSYVGLVEFLDSPFEQQVNDPDEFDFSYEFFNSCDIEFVPLDSISLVYFALLLRLILLIINP